MSCHAQQSFVRPAGNRGKQSSERERREDAKRSHWGTGSKAERGGKAGIKADQRKERKESTQHRH
jgi:hypothetical protein